MKAEKVSVLVGKKKTQSIQDPKKFSWSWNINYGVTGTLEPGEKYEDVLASLSHDLKRQVNEAFGEPAEQKVQLFIVK